jgi:hypothetical protein
LFMPTTIFFCGHPITQAELYHISRAIHRVAAVLIPRYELCSDNPKAQTAALTLNGQPQALNGPAVGFIVRDMEHTGGMEANAKGRSIGRKRVRIHMEGKNTLLQCRGV